MFGNKALSRSSGMAALMAALLMGGTGYAKSAAPAAEAKPSYSKPFVTAAGPIQTALTAAKGKVLDAAALEGLKQKLAVALAAASNPDDQIAVGGLAINVGEMAKDEALKRKGVNLMLTSGKAGADLMPKLHYFAGQFAYNAKEYPLAITELQLGLSGSPQNYDAAALLSDAYIRNNQAGLGLDILQQTIAKMKAAGTPVPENWYRSGLGGAYRAKLLDQAVNFSADLVTAYPTKENWAAAISSVRVVAHYPVQETLDLMRLMGRTNSYAEGRDYIEYIQAADPRRLPGEVLDVINAGASSKLLNLADPFVVEAKGMANGRLVADKASLPALERDARTGNAATASGAGDALLSYRDPVKAADLYSLALGKPGVDANRVLTRLGIAQLDKGDYAGAQLSFAKVEGPRKPLARLWTIYANQKAAGK